MKSLNLFGEMQETDRNKKKYQNWKIRNKYRKGSRGHKCKLCIHLIRKSYSKVYYSCALMGDSNGPATDIRVNNVCDLFEKHEE